VSKGNWTVLAAGAHPDDIEFGMAGTLLLLKQAGAQIHMWNLADGSCGTADKEPTDIVRQRLEEAQASATLAGAILHPAIAGDLGLFYEPGLLAKAAAIFRRVKPDILLLPSPQDYMEDHQNACRLLTGAAFVRGMRNFRTEPESRPVEGEVVLYHALPHGLRDGLRRLVRPGQYVDVRPVLPQKRAMLACHKSQKEWLDVSQGMDAYLNDMETMARQVGKLSGRFEAAEGWRRHNHLGYAAKESDPLSEILGSQCWVDLEYEKELNSWRDLA
jgi:LmbE family N-acetylglucosaminyl deacetylase